MTWANNFFGNAASNIAIISKRWRCNGNEKDLFSCPQNSRSNCAHYKNAGVYCYGKFHIIQLSLSTYSWYMIIMHAYMLGRTYDTCQEGDLRLANESADGLGGRVEVCLDDFWGTVCDDGWDMRDATTVCRQLELSGKLIYYYTVRPSIN